MQRVMQLLKQRLGTIVSFWTVMITLLMMQY